MAGWIPTALGIVAGLLSTASFVPQVWKAWKERNTKAISMRMYIVTVTAFTLWTIYGFLIGNFTLIVFNLLSLALSATILGLKIRNDRLERAEKTPDESPAREPGMARSG
jgi:MtN3 and saliva related transmembrane protein